MKDVILLGCLITLFGNCMELIKAGVSILLWFYLTGVAEKEVESYPEFVSSAAENRTHEGYLHKRGTLLKGWKQRWFVLDSMKHQVSLAGHDSCLSIKLDR